MEWAELCAPPSSPLLLLCSSMSNESRLPSGTSEARQAGPDQQAAELDWDQLMEMSPWSLQGWKRSQLQELLNTLVQVTGVKGGPAPFAGLISTPKFACSSRLNIWT